MDKRTILAMIRDGRTTPREGMAMLQRLAQQPAPAPAPGPPQGAVTRPPEVAIIGMACRFPGARDLDGFWDLLREGRDAVGQIPADRWDVDAWYHPDPREPRKTYSKWAGCIDDFDAFDAAFFKISPAEAELMDPQQRHFLMVAWHALEHAGYSDRDLEKRRCGVFVGTGSGDYRARLEDAGSEAGAYAFMGNSDAILTARIAYHLNLRGPSLAVDTACSSSLVALHLARESLCREETDLALAGGVAILTTPRFHIMSSKAGMLSPTGRCHTFDDDADGFVPGEGVAAVILKPLAHALADGDTIHAVIAGSAINQDGRTNGITAPSAPSQTALEVEVYQRFGIDPEQVGYVEAHGTGTRLGDPIEVRALTDSFRRFTPAEDFCYLGSVKTNIGHALSAAGIAGVIKAVLSLKHRTIPPSLHYDRLNAHLELDGSPFRIAARRVDWSAPSGGVRHAAVSSFGFSGTNAHLVLREAPAEMPVSRPEPGPVLIAVSARTDVALERRVTDLAAYVKQTPDLDPRDLSFTLLCGRSHFGRRAAWVVADPVAWAVSFDGQTVDWSGVALNGDPLGGLETAAAAYVSGQDLDWRRLFQGVAHRRVTLPVYPFEETAFPPPVRARQDVAMLHPLVHRNTSDLHAQRFETLLDGDAFFLRDHLVAGRKALPGVAYLEAARVAGGLSLAKAPNRLRGVVWERLLLVEAHRLMAVMLQPKGSGARFEVIADPEGERPARHATGSLDSVAFEPAPLPLETLRDALTERVDGDACYAALAQTGLKYGPGFQLIEAMWSGRGEVLARLRAPLVDSAAWVIHPARCDALLQAMFGLMPRDAATAAWLPASVDEVLFGEDTRSGCWAYVRARSGDPVSDGVLIIDADLADERGRVLLSMKGVTVRRVSAGQARPAVLAATTVPSPSPSPSPSKARAALTAEVCAMVGRVLRVEADEVDPNEALSEFGFDSISYTELGDRLNDFLNLALPPSVFFEFRTLMDLVDYLLEHHGAVVAARFGEASEAVAAPVVQTRVEAPVARFALAADAAQIAVIGMAARLPGSPDLDAFWEHLAAGRHMIGQVPADRWDWRAIDGDPVTQRNRCNVRFGAFMDDVYAFDPLFFGISPREAEAMDPQQRLFLETVVHAIEDAGYAPGALAGGQVGVFAGVANQDYNELWRQTTGEINAHAATGTAHSIVPNRVSFLLDFHGPSEPVDTACSSSLVAVHRAAAAMREGMCDMALAGGVNVMLTPTLHIAFNKAGMLNPEGRCRTFDQAAAGYVRGEGVGVVLLKPLAQAEADGDPIRAVILGSSVKHGGHAASLTAPNPNAQAELLLDAWRRAGVTADQISYIETHGTGTPLGDPAEVSGIVKAFKHHQRDGVRIRGERCGLGAVKTNIGHLETAAGIAGIVKMLLALRHGQLPGNHGFETLNPYIDLGASPCYIPRECRPWRPLDADGRPMRRIAGISSFGFGGAYAHVVLGEYEGEAAASAESGVQVVPLSARDPQRLRVAVEQLLQYCRREAGVSLADMAHTLRVGRDAFAARLALVVDAKAALVEGLQCFLEGRSHASLYDEAKARAGVAAPQGGDPHDLARAWVKGAVVDWSLAGFAPGRRVSLPGYPFDRMVCRPPISDNTVSSPALHPLIDRNQSTLAQHQYAVTLDPARPWLADHAVAGRVLLSGTAYLEWARAAGVLAAERRVTVIRDLTWSAPLLLPGRAIPAEIHLAEGRAGVRFRMVSGQSIHAQGVLAYAVLSPGSAPDPVSGERMDAARCYDFLTGLGLNYGPTYRVIDHALVGETRAEARLMPPTDDAGFDYHPALLDGLLQTAALLAGKHGDGALLLPHRLDEAQFHGKPEGPCRAVVALRDLPSPDGAVLDLDLFDALGEALVSLRGLMVRPLANAPARPVETSSFVAVRRVERQIESPVGEREQPLWVLASPESTLFEPAGFDHVFQAIDDDLRTALKAADQPVLVVRRPKNDEALFLIELFRELGPSLARAKGTLVYLHPDSRYWPGGAPALALCRTAAMEYPGLRVRTLGLAEGQAVDRAWLTATVVEPAAWRVRDGAVWETVFEPFEPEPATPLDLADKTILITGGLGGLGLIFARELHRAGARLVLTGRRRAEPEQLAEFGDRAVYLVADLMDPEAIVDLLPAIYEWHGPLKGVIHAAGLTEDALIAKKSPEQIKRVLGPKVFGTQILNELTSHEPLDWFVMFGSLAGLTGNPGQADYAYANGFLADLAARRQGPGATICLEWPYWAEGGMRLPQRTLDFIKAQTGVTPLPTALGVDLFHRAMARGESCAVFHGEVAGIRKMLWPDRKPEPVKRRAKVGSRDLAEKLENDLLDMVADVLKLEREYFDLDDPMDTFGFDSINLSDLSNRLSTTYGIELLPSVLFEYNTLKSFIGYLLDAHAAEVAAYYGEAVETAAVEPSSPEPVTLPARASVALEPMSGAEPIAIVGMSGRLPGSIDLDAFWDNLVKGRDLVSEIPADRWDWRPWYGEPAEGKTRVKSGAFMPLVDRFDAAFFGISPMEAALMDPQHRLFLQAVREAMEDAGHQPADFSGANVALYVGVSSFDYQEVLRHAEGGVHAHELTGNAHSVLANRTSFYFNLRGASEPVDTACSSSLVAVLKAVRALRAGECDAALTGGVNVLLSPLVQFAFAKAGMLSPGGRCKTFDADADGYVRGEGVGALLLKPLADAERDGNPIHALIRGGAVNHGGRANTLVAPNPNAQAEVIAAAVRDAGVDPGSISYIETHGTGTALGDPIEINGLKKAFEALFADGRSKPAGPCVLGSVKTYLGHLEAAAGISGLLKLCLCFRHAYLPGNLHFKRLNPYIRLNDSHFQILGEGGPWAPPTDGGRPLPRRAGISSFGFGGVNAHLILEEYIAKSARPVRHGGPVVFVVSAKTDERLRAYAQRLLDFERSRPEPTPLHDTAFTLQVGREALTHRLAVVAEDWDAVFAGLTAFLEDRDHADVLRGAGAKSELAELVNDDEGRSFVDALIKGGRLRKAAKLWVGGVAVDWRGLYAGGTPARVHLPSYPFAQTRFWCTDRSPWSGPDAAELRLASKPVSPSTPALEAPPKPGVAPELTPPVADADDEIAGFVRARLAGVAGLDHIDEDADLAELGLDSIFAMELLRDVESRFGLRLYPNELAEHNTLNKLVRHIRGELADLARRNGSAVSVPMAASTPVGPTVFLLSTPRAGSTLFRVMLMGHSRCFAPPELHLLPFPDMAVRAETLKAGGKGFLGEGLIQAVRDLEGCDVETATHTVLAWEHEARPVSDVYRFLTDRLPDRLLVDKSPSYADQPHILAQATGLGDQVRYIHLIRHPLSVAASFVKNRFDKMLGVDGDPWRHALDLWTRYNTNLEQFLADQPHVFTVRFEDLVADPETWMRALCEFLDLPYEAALIQPYSGERMTAGLHSRSMPIGDPNFLGHTTIEPGQAFLWRDHLGKAGLLDEAGRALAEKYGYLNPTPQSLTPQQAFFLREYEAHPAFHLVHRMTLDDVDESRLVNAWRQVVLRHGMLRHRFFKEDGAWRQTPVSDLEATVVIKDLRRVRKDRREGTLATFEDELNALVDLSAGRMAVLGLVRLPKKQTRVILVIHHLVADGLSLAVIGEDLIRLLEKPGMAFSALRSQEGGAVSAPVVFGLPDVWRTWAQAPQALKLNGEGKNIAAFEASMCQTITPLPPAWAALNPAKVHGLVGAAFFSALSTWMGVAQPVAALRRHGRTGDEHGQIGWYAADTPLQLDPSVGLAETALAFRAAHDAVPADAWLKAACAGALPPLYRVTPVRLNYQPAALLGGAALAATDLYREPEADRGYLLDCIVRVGRDEMLLLIRYPEHLIGCDRTAKLLEDWRALLVRWAT